MSYEYDLKSNANLFAPTSFSAHKGCLNTFIRLDSPAVYCRLQTFFNGTLKIALSMQGKLLPIEATRSSST